MATNVETLTRMTVLSSEVAEARSEMQAYEAAAGRTESRETYDHLMSLARLAAGRVERISAHWKLLNNETA